MKKMIVLGVFLLGFVCLSAVTQFNLGFDFAGKQNWKMDQGTKDFDVKSGLSSSLEIMKITDYFLIGIGLEYQFPRSIPIRAGYNKFIKANFSFVPVYVALKIPLNDDYLLMNDKNTLEIDANLGYNAFIADDFFKNDRQTSGDIFFAAGLSYLREKFICQLQYKINNGKINSDEHSNYAKITNTQIGFTIGLRLDNL